MNKYKFKPYVNQTVGRSMEKVKKNVVEKRSKRRSKTKSFDLMLVLSVVVLCYVVLSFSLTPFYIMAKRKRDKPEIEKSEVHNEINNTHQDILE